MRSIYHKADTRGHADHGWLESYHTFSFAGYYNPERVHFGMLRVLNDDQVAPGMGFGSHPHNDMEIISIPLEGDLEHKDSMGNSTVIKEGDIQVMSAGSGVRHSEYNKNADRPVKFLQIWIIPNKKGGTPRYDQITLDKERLTNKLAQILSPNPNDEGVWIQQNAWFHMGNLEGGTEVSYDLMDKTNNGVYAFLLEGSIQLADHTLSRRDGLGIWEIEKLKIKALENSKVLLMEVPLNAH